MMTIRLLLPGELVGEMTVRGEVWRVAFWKEWQSLLVHDVVMITLAVV